MRRIATCLALLTACATAVPAVAGGHTAPQIHDPKGDWAVASQDILDGTITATSKQLAAELHLAAPPATGIRTEYAVVIDVGCTAWVLDYTWNGGLPGSAATLQKYACLSDNTAADLVNDQPVASYPATPTNTASGVRITAATTKQLRRGVRVTAGAITRAAGVVIVGVDNAFTVGGDIAYGNGPFVLGS